MAHLDDTIIRTDRFALHPLSVDHAAGMIDGLRDPRSYDFIPDLPPDSVEALAARYACLANQRSPDGTEIWLNWAIGAAHGPSLFGYVQCTVRPADASALIAYLVFPAHWRQGIAAESVSAAIAHVLARYPVARIEAVIDTRNVASIALVESLGFVRTGFVRSADEFKGAISDEYDYAYCPPSG
ncbi:GNAT family N-acetyltransferase [Burkholderia alba]|uniref:GNAT family N-acetyltransferase n=1 Tax=Burkholderia alba TaxID=2683677 RepID=UPI002B05B2EF|nr:GNAT family protein [Burkholderia alba]